MEKRNLLKDKMKGFGSSGVSVMTGKNNGVSKRMKDDSPFLVSIHCMAHRLALCTSQVANGIPYLAKFKEILAALQGWARPHHCTNPALQLKLSLKKTVKGTICPLQNLGKKLERKHTRRVLSRYRNCKLKQNVESIFSCTFKVHSKVTFQSHFTEHVRLMLNQAWWTHVAIFTTLFTNMRTQKFKSRLHNYVFRCPQS